ncbi:MAG: hypothetical protein V2A34_15550, partial [Lentisphaerota bacterium]
AAAPCAHAGSWTNAVGDTVEAEATAFDGSHVTLRKPDGREMRLPLFSLAANEQKRVKQLFGVEEAPGAIRQAFRLAEIQLERARVLRNDEAIDGEEFSARKNAVLEAFLRECAAQSFPEDGEDVQRCLRKLDP